LESATLVEALMTHALCSSQLSEPAGDGFQIGLETSLLLSYWPSTLHTVVLSFLLYRQLFFEACLVGCFWQYTVCQFLPCFTTFVSS